MIDRKAGGSKKRVGGEVRGILGKKGRGLRL